MHIAPIRSRVEGIHERQVDLIDTLQSPRPHIANYGGAGAGCSCFRPNAQEAASGDGVDQVGELQVHVPVT
jgi:hypothetical protein